METAPTRLRDLDGKEPLLEVRPPSVSPGLVPGVQIAAAADERLRRIARLSSRGALDARNKSGQDIRMTAAGLGSRRQSPQSRAR